jgi:hypothetical protein
MERERFARMRRVLKEAAANHHDNPRCTHGDRTILLVFLWAALHKRPVSWACDPRHWPGDLRPRPLPSQATMSRRLRCQAVLELLERWMRILREHLPRTGVKVIDGKALTIGGCGKDPDAGTGYGAGHVARGYKLHWVMDLSGAVDHWLVAPLNFSEQAAAAILLERVEPGAYVLSDHNYDSSPLYESAGRCGVKLLAAPPRGAKGLGHRTNSPYRISALRFLRSPTGKRILQRHRVRIEQVHGRMTASSVGLSHLPMHARRQHRVAQWVAILLLILTDLQVYDRASKAA